MGQHCSKDTKLTAVSQVPPTFSQSRALDPAVPSVWHLFLSFVYLVNPRIWRSLPLGDFPELSNLLSP